VEDLQTRMSRFSVGSSGAVRRLSVRVFPTIEEMAVAEGDSRFVTYSRRGGEVTVHVAADAPDLPDLVAPAFASAAFLAGHPEAGKLPLLLAGYDAWRAGRWWGRTPAQWGALLAAADLWVPAGELTAAGERGASDLLLVGEAAAILEAWASLDGREAVERALGSGRVEIERLAVASVRAAREPLEQPVRRKLPREFLRGDFISAISVMPYAFQRRASTPEIGLPSHEPHEENEEAILRVIQDGKGRGMFVLVKPQIWLWRGFTGDIAMADETAWKAWFRQYRRFLVGNAVVSEAGGADLFDVGVELCSTESHEKEWRFLIAAVRAATSAPLLYFCNWARGAAKVPFWDALDGVGVDFYDPLSSSWSAGDEDLVRGAREAARPLGLLAERLGKYVYLTEVGFPSVAAAWVTPNEEAPRRPFSNRDPARAARAIFEVFGRSAWCRGLFWWKVFSSGRPAEADQKTFNILGRPIEATIREGYRRIAAEDSRTPN
jgi:hypothetical protein